MASVLSETVETVDLKRFEKIYQNQLNINDVTPKAQFEYAWCLIRSKYPSDINKGILLLEDLFCKNDEGKRDYLYYLAVGYARVKEHAKALEFCRSFLSVEPGNQQVISLEQQIKKKMEKEGMVGMAVAGGFVLAVGAILGVGMAIVSKVKS